MALSRRNATFVDLENDGHHDGSSDVLPPDDIETPNPWFDAMGGQLIDPTPCDASRMG